MLSVNFRACAGYHQLLFVTTNIRGILGTRWPVIRIESDDMKTDFSKVTLYYKDVNLASLKNIALFHLFPPLH